MENCNAFIARWASVVVLYFGLLNVVVESSRAVHEDVKLEGTQTPSIAFGETRTGYHFQPPKNWINGEFSLVCYISKFSSMFLLLFYIVMLLSQFLFRNFCMQ